MNINDIKKMKIKRKLYSAAASVCLLIATSCSNGLDIVPDNVATIDHAFANTVEAEKYLFTCYNYLPNNGSIDGNVGLLAGDELWIPNFRNYFRAAAWTMIARGQQNSGEPAVNYWDGMNEGKDLFEALRHCNIFLENVSNTEKVRDLPIDKRARWIAEVKFLKAFYHYYLVRMYGPIPLIEKNIPISAPPEDVRVKRRPVDECVNYITTLLDESYQDLPLLITNKGDELGRITKPINRAVKARLLLMAASPLFNGNTDYNGFLGKDGEALFNPTYDEGKWKLAADAAKQAIEDAEASGNKLYYYQNPAFEMSDTTMTQMSIRGSVTERWNSEVVWGLSNSRANTMQQAGQPLLHADMGPSSAYASLAPTLKVVEQFYTHNGVPIDEDKTLDFRDIKRLRIATAAERVNFQVMYESARINFDRENRFYASTGFDGGKWLTADLPARKDYEAYTVKAKLGQISSGSVMGLFSETGYYAKKVVNWESTFAANSSIREYPWPEIRLAEVYLMYAEALNETSGPTADVHKYLDLIRKRAGLESVANAWQKYSTNPLKPTTKDGMRALIRRERLIELAFEGIRFWDLRRWKESVKEINTPVKGWDINQKDASAYYQVRTIFQQKFIAPRDYLWPIRLSELTVNPNLIQNPGW